MKTKETNPTRPGSPTPCKQALILAPFFARSLTLVAHSLLLNRTETLATQANALTVAVARVSSVSSRGRRESWDERKKTGAPALTFAQ